MSSRSARTHSQLLGCKEDGGPNMQIAGSRCAVCRQNVGAMRDGAGCLACAIVVHKACAQVCPQCGHPFLQGERVQAMPSRAAQTELDRPTSVTVLARLTFVGVPLAAIWVLGGIVVLGSDPPAGLASIVGGVIAAILCAALGSGFLRGLAFARRFYLWATPFPLAVDVAMGYHRQPEFRWWGSGYKSARIAYGHWC